MRSNTQYMSTDYSSTSDDELHRDTRRVVKARFEPEVFERINKIRRDRGVGWSTVVLHGIAEIEQEIPPYHERYRVESNRSVNDD